MCEKPFITNPRYRKTLANKMAPGTGKTSYWRSNPLNELDFAILPCGKCDACRLKKSKEWAHRIELESEFYNNKCAYVTLTYNDENLPQGNNLDKAEIQKYLKRLRWHLNGRELKYYAIGEYGPKHDRPHFHLIIMNVDGTDHYGNHDRLRKKLPIIEQKNDWYWLHKAWQDKGFTKIEKPEGGAASYVSGYVVKTNRRQDDIEKLGLSPEFRIMSKNLGKRQVLRLARKIKKKLHSVSWPIRYLEYGKKKFKKPLGRHLSRILHIACDRLDSLLLGNLDYNYEQIKTYGANGLQSTAENWYQDNKTRINSMVQKWKIKQHLA